MKDETLETKMRAVAFDLDGETSPGDETDAVGLIQALRIAREYAAERTAPLVAALERLIGVYKRIPGTNERLVLDTELALAAEQAHAEARREPREGSEGTQWRG
jgi:hypothetical protein